MQTDVTRAIALAAAIFCVMMTGLLAYLTAQGKVDALVNSRDVVKLHDELRTRPKDEELKKEIRRLDLELRQRTFFRLQASHHGARALLAGGIVFLAAAHRVRVLRRRLPDPAQWGARDGSEAGRAARACRTAVAAAAAVTAFAGVLAALHPARLPAPAAPGPAEGPAVPAYPTLAEMRTQWPAFRGAEGQGVAADAKPPLTWDAAAGVNVRWKTPVPMPGMSSPVIWSNLLFLTGGTKQSNCVAAFDTETGRLLWNAEVRIPGGVRPPPAGVGDETGHAAPTAVTDGRRVVAVFANGEIAAFDFGGKQLWARNIGPLDNAYGFAASLAIHQDLVFVQIDRGAVEDAQSRLLALEARTGRERWQAKREVGGSWASPVVVEIAGEPVLVTCAAPLVLAYDPVTGAEKWRNKCLESDVAPSAVFASNIVVVVSPNTAIHGLRPGASNLLWTAEDGIPDATSPVTDGRHLFIITSEGMLSCFELETGKIVWQHEFEDHFYASPVLAGNRLVLVGRKGGAFVLEAGGAYKELGRGSMGEPCCASPVPRGNRLYIRGEKNLFCIEGATQ